MVEYGGTSPTNQINLQRYKLTSADASRIETQINDFVGSVSPSQDVMDAIYRVYTLLKTKLEESATIQRELGSPIEVHIYGSVASGLFDAPLSDQQNKSHALHSDLDLTIIYDE